MHTRRIAAILISACAGIAPLTAVAIEPIPETPGWRGFVLVGAGYSDLESNLVAGNSLVTSAGTTINSVNIGPQGDERLASGGDRRAQLHLRQPVAGFLRHLARGRGHAGRGRAAGPAQGSWKVSARCRPVSCSAAIPRGSGRTPMRRAWAAMRRIAVRKACESSGSGSWALRLRRGFPGATSPSTRSAAARVS